MLCTAAHTHKAGYLWAGLAILQHVLMARHNHPSAGPDSVPLTATACKLRAERVQTG